MEPVTIVFTIIGAAAFLCVLASFALLLLTAKSLSFAKGYGTRKRETCGNEYQEHETARYELFMAYNAKVRKMMTLSITLLMTALVAPLIFISYKTGSVLVDMFRKGFLNAFQTEKVSFLLLILSSLLSAFAISSYIIFWTKDIPIKKVTNYTNKKNPIDDVARLGGLARMLKVVIVSASILVALLSTMYMSYRINKYISDNDKALYIGFATVIVISGLLLTIVHSTRKSLHSSLFVKYNTAMSDLQSTVSSLLNDTVFRRNMEINYKRAHPRQPGDPNLSDINDSYKYAEHRPGTDSYSTDEITIGNVKEVMAPHIAKTYPQAQRAEMMLMLEQLYKSKINSNDIIKYSDVMNLITRIFPLSEQLSTDLAATVNIANLKAQLTSLPISSADVTTLIGTVLQNIGMSQTQRTTVMSAINSTINAKVTHNHDHIMALVPLIVNASPANVRPTADTLKALMNTAISTYTTNRNQGLTMTYRDLQTAFAEYATAKQATLNSETRIKLENIMAYVLYYDRSQDDLMQTFDTIHYLIQSRTVLPQDVKTAIANDFKSRQYNASRDGQLSNYQRAMRAMRGLESSSVDTVNKFTTYVTWVGVLLVAIVSYIIIRIGMSINPQATIIAICGGLLLGVFAITWYSWFFTKLML